MRENEAVKHGPIAKTAILFSVPSTESQAVMNLVWWLDCQDIYIHLYGLKDFFRLIFAFDKNNFAMQMKKNCLQEFFFPMLRKPRLLLLMHGGDILDQSLNKNIYAKKKGEHGLKAVPLVLGQSERIQFVAFSSHRSHLMFEVS